MTQRIDKTSIINASLSAVWDTLTNPDRMKQWMEEPGMEIEIVTDWKAGSPIVIKGFHHIKFENKGTVLRFEPEKVIEYNYLSSLSRLPDKPENYTTIEFRLTPVKNGTSLTLTLGNFPTETIFKHVDFYWSTTISILKKLVEEQ
jgi:uncharacterized protein YndB with AHSA1/START domain